MNIVDQEPVTLAEVSNILKKKDKEYQEWEGELRYEQKRSLDHASKFKKVSLKDVAGMRKELTALDLDLSSERVVKIIDQLPKSVDDVRANLPHEGREAQGKGPQIPAASLIQRKDTHPWLVSEFFAKLTTTIERDHGHREGLRESLVLEDGEQEVPLEPVLLLVGQAPTRAAEQGLGETASDQGAYLRFRQPDEVRGVVQRCTKRQQSATNEPPGQ